MSENNRLWYQAEYHSTIIIVAAAFTVLFLLGRGALSQDYFIAYWIAAFIVFFLMILCFSLKVECDNENMYLSYGIGLITTEFPIYGIAEAGPMRNESIFSLPYDPKGEGAIRIVLRNGKKFVLPADNPKDFAQRLLHLAQRG